MHSLFVVMGIACASLSHAGFRYEPGRQVFVDAGEDASADAAVPSDPTPVSEDLAGDPGDALVVSEPVTERPDVSPEAREPADPKKATPALALQETPDAPTKMTSVESTSVSAEPELAPPAETVEPKVTWTLEPGSLREQLTSWASREGATVHWSRDTRDVVVRVGATFEGSFREAAQSVISSLWTGGVRIRGEWYESNRVLVVDVEDAP